ncbi:hypothetical protein [Noviherbaspirillum aridicola]|uniref:Flagellar protein FliL n=1 Tax=Noviherbaspirillum aridicola TaxID=2849687 RepID=A0ABQ4Q3J3_9BURK|nr:hypothetical protein [Noviherbaspirillum aridicola]GIZ51719.1 hypothetical protein NCCP691_17330 [Noviherbaspirillum aridicola]
MPKPTARDRSVRNTVLVSIVALIVGFGAIWLYFERAQRLQAEVHYLTLPRVAISRDGHSMAATVAIRTDGTAADWAAGNRRGLEEAVKVALMQADPVASRGPRGIRQLQQDIAETCNQLLKTDKVREAVVTDFLVSEGDY